MEIITNFRTLMILANEVGNAIKSGDSVKIEEAILKLEQYKELIKQSDRFTLNISVGDLNR